MKKLYLYPCLLATLVMPVFAGISVTSPTNGAQVQSSVHYVATAQSPACAKGVAAIGIFTAPYKLAYSTPGSKLDTYLTLSAGTYNTVVQEWDNCGWSASVPITITVGSGGTSSGGATAGVFSNLQSSSWWNGYVLLRTSGYLICNTCSPSGPLATWSTQQGIKSPALSSGGSMKFSIGGTMPYSDILWNVKFTKHLADEKSVPNFHNFTYDVWFFGTNLELSQALEFDINQFINGKSFIWGHECRIAGGHEWDTWDNRGYWVKSGISCRPVSNAWNHLIIKVQRTWDNRLLFQSINLNGNVSTLNRYDNPTPTTWYGMTINYQMDGNINQQAYSVYLDKVNFSYY